MKSTLEAAVIPTLLLKVSGREYTVEFPLSAVIQAEEKTGRNLKSLSDWFALPTRDIPAILAAGLSKHHPDVTEDELRDICDALNPEALDEVQYALCKLAFPRSMTRLEETRGKGKIVPNALSADAC